MSHWLCDLDTVYEGTQERKVKVKDMGSDDATLVSYKEALATIVQRHKAFSRYGYMRCARWL